MDRSVPYSSLPDDGVPAIYEHGPDSTSHENVPPGHTVGLRLDSSAAYPATSRRAWIHVPAACASRTPSSAMFFQDGWWYLDPAGDVRGGIVLDNLTHAGAIPPMVGVFVDPGVHEGEVDPAARKNRNREYDAFDDRYATLLVDEVGPPGPQLVR